MGEYGLPPTLRWAGTRGIRPTFLWQSALSSYIKQGWDEAATTQDDLSSWFPDKQSATGLLCELIRPGDTYLVKASRSLEFEGLVDFLSDLDNRLTGDDPC